MNDYVKANPDKAEAVAYVMALSQGPKGVLSLLVGEVVNSTVAGQKFAEKVEEFKANAAIALANYMLGAEKPDEQLKPSEKDDESLIGGGRLILDLLSSGPPGRAKKETHITSGGGSVNDHRRGEKAGKTEKEKAEKEKAEKEKAEKEKAEKEKAEKEKAEKEKAEKEKAEKERAEAAHDQAIKKIPGLGDIDDFLASQSINLDKKLGTKIGKGELPYEMSRAGKEQAKLTVKETLESATAVSPLIPSSAVRGNYDLIHVYSSKTDSTVSLRVLPGGKYEFDTLIPEKSYQF